MIVGLIKHLRHPELVSGSISPLDSLVRETEWMLKQVQHDGWKSKLFPSPSGEGIEGWGIGFKHRAALYLPTPSPPPEGEGSIGA